MSQALFQKCAGEQINKDDSCSAPELLGHCDRWGLGTGLVPALQELC